MKMNFGYVKRNKMKISKDTRISELIKWNKKSIDAIASIAKPLEKLKNPILRKLMASRVSIQEAAQMGNTSLAEFERVLQPLGFEFEKENPAVNSQDQNQKPTWLSALDADQIKTFDVRQILAQGHDPLKEIMKRFKEVPVGSALCIINTFVPTPLVRLFEKENVLVYTETFSEEEFHTYFLKQFVQKSSSNGKSEIKNEDEESFHRNKARFGDLKIKEIDVRQLEMPGPMETILQELSVLEKGQALFVHHKRIPIYLLDELEEKGYLIHIFNLSETEVKLLIEKN